MIYVAKRGVCIGVDQHLLAGDPVPADMSPATVQFLCSIGAIAEAPDAPKREPERLVKAELPLPLEPAADSAPAAHQSNLSKPAPAKTGIQEK